MPCDDWTHDHNDEEWPASSGELVIEPCERYCDYCPLNKRKKFFDATTLRGHVWARHISPTQKPATHPDVWIADFDGGAVKKGRLRSKMISDKKKEEKASQSHVRTPGLQRAKRKKKKRKLSPSVLAITPSRPSNEQNGQSTQTAITIDSDDEIEEPPLARFKPRSQPAKITINSDDEVKPEPLEDAKPFMPMPSEEPTMDHEAVHVDENPGRHAIL